jgi:VirE N-terminal domain
MQVTIFKNIFSKEPHFITVDKALERIKLGASKALVLDIRLALDKEKANKLKLNLPSICFSGKFGADRKDEQLVAHSGFIVLDFDDISDLRDKQTEIIQKDFVYACWVSPSGNGLKALVKIADGKKHREHFQSLQEVFPEVDRSGINVSRVCYESFDPDIYINDKATVYTKAKKIEKIVVNEIETIDDSENFRRILKWLTNKNDAFVTGERNTYIFKLASACCRFGINEEAALSLISAEYLVSNDFTMSEMRGAVKSGYRANRAIAGSAIIQKEKLVNKTTNFEIDVKNEFVDEKGDNYRVEDVVYGIDVKDKALLINQNGFDKVMGVGVPELDHIFKPKRGEITLLTGIGNYGKTAWQKSQLLSRIIMYGEKIATFSPEDTPAEEYFHDYVEMLLGCECTPFNPNRPANDIYEAAYDYISKHIFYISAEMLSPTPQYIKEKFLELIVQEKVDFCCIDPFNQMTNDYKGFGGRTDKYLETLLADFSRFAKKNDVYFWVIAHPKLMERDRSGNYKCPDVFDINDGAMWNNKMDNITVYHRPFAQTDPKSPVAEFHSKKIKKKSVGRKGFVMVEYIWDRRRFFIEGRDFIQEMLNKKGLDFWKRKEANQSWLPYKDEDGGEVIF